MKNLYLLAEMQTFNFSTTSAVSPGSLYTSESFCKQYIGKADALCPSVIKKKWFLLGRIFPSFPVLN